MHVAARPAPRGDLRNTAVELVVALWKSDRLTRENVVVVSRIGVSLNPTGAIGRADSSPGRATHTKETAANVTMSNIVFIVFMVFSNLR